MADHGDGAADQPKRPVSEEMIEHARGFLDMVAARNAEAQLLGHVQETVQESSSKAVERILELNSKSRLPLLIEEEETKKRLEEYSRLCNAEADKVEAELDAADAAAGEIGSEVVDAGRVAEPDEDFFTPALITSTVPPPSGTSEAL